MAEANECLSCQRENIKCSINMQISPHAVTTQTNVFNMENNVSHLAGGGT